MPDSTEAKPQRARHQKYMLVRHGRMHHIGLFSHNENEVPKTPTKVVVKTDKGLELGEVVGHLTCYRGGRFKLDSEQIDEYYKVSDIELCCRRAGKLIRFASEDDLSEQHHFQKAAKEEIATCRRISKELNLAMKVVEAEHILGGERIIFYFMAEGRIDFRELVRRLSHEFQTRIEMRQIGARDEAKLLSDVESCGQECCCRRYLKYLKPVNMRMAKMQKATLDPTKISGYCGRLKCCLRYEDEMYGALKKKLPKKNFMVRTPKGEGRVLDTQVLTQLVMVEYESNEREAVPVDDIQVLGPATHRRRTPEAKPPQVAEEPKTEESSKDSPAKEEAPVQEKTAAKESERSERPVGRGRSRPRNRDDGKGENKGRTDKRRRRRGGQGRRRGRGKPGANKDGENKPTGKTPENRTGNGKGNSGSEPSPQAGTKPERTENNDA